MAEIQNGLCKYFKFLIDRSILAVAVQITYCPDIVSEHCKKVIVSTERGRRTVTRRELQSLTGLLQHATAVVGPGRAFLQRLYALQRVGSEPSHNIRLNTVARADIIWWELLISLWNGISMLVNPKQDVADTTVASDALGNWGGRGTMSTVLVLL